MMGIPDCIFTLLGKVLSLFAILQILYLGGLWMCKRVWRGRELWQAQYCYGSQFDNGYELQGTLLRHNRLFWCSPCPQQIGHYYQIDLGKERVIRKIYDNSPPRNEVPYKWELRLYNRGGDKRTEPNHIARKPIFGRGIADIQFLPTKVERIQIRIVQPNLDNHQNPYFWHIYGFELEEVIFLGHFIGRRV